ncbi:MAG: phosphate uptake regulator PhoU [Candidatus Brocadiia bacterium]
MGKSQNKDRPADVRELERRLVLLGNTVESLFADSVVALVERGAESADELRAEDYKAHEQWREVDGLCVELLRDGRAEDDHFNHVAAALKIAADLRRIADESMRIGEDLRACAASSLLEADPSGLLPQMVELAQEMLSEMLGAFVDHDGTRASALHLVFRELASARTEAGGKLPQAVEDGSLAAAVGMALFGVTQRLERIGDEVLDACNQVTHLNSGQ